MRGEALTLAGAIAAKTGAGIMGRTSLARLERGAGRVALPRLPYPIDLSLETLKPYRTLVLVGAPDPSPSSAIPASRAGWRRRARKSWRSPTARMTLWTR